MKVAHAIRTRNNTIRAIPITENFLVREKSGMLRWAEPNDSFSMFSNTGGNRQVMTNIRLDDTDHSPDLFLYTNMTKTEIHDPTAIMEDNRVYLNRSRKWYVRQFKEIDRPGIRRFTGLPLNIFLKWWRKNIPATEFSLVGLNNDQVRILIGNPNSDTDWFRVFVKWPEMQVDLSNSTTKPAYVKKLYPPLHNSWASNLIIPWMHAHCHKGFIPFSDYDSMFVDAEDEVLYITDLLG